MILTLATTSSAAESRITVEQASEQVVLPLHKMLTVYREKRKKTVETPLKLRGVSAVYWKISGRPRVVKPLAANSVTTTLFCPLEQWQISSFPSSLQPTTIPT